MKINAKWICSPKITDSVVNTFKKSFKTDKGVKKAELCASAMGLYTVYLNGKKVGNKLLTPGWTSYNKRIQYQTYDITAELKKENVIELGLGFGWAVGQLSWALYEKAFADHPSVIAWINIEYADGTKEQIITDEKWDVYTSEVLFAELYQGETIDKTAKIKLLGKAVLSDVKTKLVAQISEDVTEHERIRPIEVIHTPKGETVLDFGQNMAGYVEVSVKAPKGSRIVFDHAEVLDKYGNFYTENMYAARNTMTYITSGKNDTFKPSYSFQGFRYIRLIEYPFKEVDIDSFVGVVIHTDIKRTGHFRCGNEKINQLYHNIIWGQKSNFIDIPTDCPQRSERLGWTGDAQVFCRTAAINYDVEKFFKKWLGDVALEQYKNGAVSGTVPDCTEKFGDPRRISAAWGDCATIIPWNMYIAYGNKKMLKENFPMMKKWVDYMHSTGPEEYLWLGGHHYGDWLAMDAGEDSYVGATSNDLIASAFFAYSTELVVKAGEVLGEDVSAYKKLYKKVRNKFREYFMENGMPKEEFPHTEIVYGLRTASDTVRKGVTQTAITLILYFGLCEENERKALADKLAELIRKAGNKMATGFVGTPYIMHALTDNGYADIAYQLLMQEENPSWLYSVCHGATTMWEHWNSLKENGDFWDKEMNSFNHYAYGAVFDWMFGKAVGIEPTEDAPAYKKIKLCPHPDKCLGFAEASFDSRSGNIRAYWYYKGDTVYYEFEIPEGVTAELKLPSGYTATLGAGAHYFTDKK